MGLVSVGPVVIEVQLDEHGHQKNLTLGAWGVPAISAHSSDRGVGQVSAGPVVIEVQLDGHGHQKNLTLGT